MPATSSTTHKARVGDFVETRGIHGQTPRRGQITEILGEGAHQRYRVQWDEAHESILYPEDGVHVIRNRPSGGTAAR